MEPLPTQLSVLDGSSASQVLIVRCDTSLSTEVMGASSHCSSLPDLPPFSGIVNSGGVLADAVLAKQSASRLRTVFAPKLVSTVFMHHQAAGSPVHQLLLYSSVASLLGSPGQANYAAANAALEGWLGAASAQGMNGIALQWGAWNTGRKDI